MEEIKKQASNIDEEGNVLYLDQERLDRKEVPFPPYKNKRKLFYFIICGLNQRVKKRSARGRADRKNYFHR